MSWRGGNREGSVTGKRRRNDEWGRKRDRDGGERRRGRCMFRSTQHWLPWPWWTGNPFHLILLLANHSWRKQLPWVEYVHNKLPSSATGLSQSKVLLAISSLWLQSWIRSTFLHSRHSVWERHHYQKKDDWHCTPTPCDYPAQGVRLVRHSTFSLSS